MAGLSDELLELRERLDRLEERAEESGTYTGGLAQGVSERIAALGRRVEAVESRADYDKWVEWVRVRNGELRERLDALTDKVDRLEAIDARVSALESAASEPSMADRERPATRADVAASEQRLVARIDALPAAPSSFVREVERIRDEMDSDIEDDTFSQSWRAACREFSGQLTTALNALGREAGDE